MSRIGRAPVTIPANVTVEVNNNVFTVKGPKGTLTQE
jgi:large subunit ribosomal protein L6